MCQATSRSIQGFVFLLLVVTPIQAQSLRGFFAPPKKNERTTEVMAPMRDGIKLSTDVTLPEGDGPWPVVLTRTPYGKGSVDSGLFAIDYLSKGYVRVTQDCRGRGKSEGVFGTFEHEPMDGFDTIAWIAKQPWCNGNVGMFGVSAMGITANFAAMTAPPNLKCTFVCVAHGCDFRYGSYPGGVFLKDLNERWFQTLGAPLPAGPRPRFGLYTKEYASRDMRNNYSNVRIPTFNVGGWYDIFSESSVENFEGLNRHGGDGAKGKQKLIMGAFGHLPLNGKLRYPVEASRLDTSMVIPWFDRWLKGIENEVDELPAARYFLMGDTFDKESPGNEWRTADAWPPESKSVEYFLADNGRLAPSLPVSDAADTYSYDPKNPVPTIGGNNLFSPRGPMDQRGVGSREDVLKFETDPLQSPVEIVGRGAIDLFVSTDAEDTDFMVKVVDVYPDGYEALVVDQAFRLRYHPGFDKPARIEAKKVYPIRFNLWSTALVFNKGHKIAVHVSSSNSPRFEAHSNTWEPRVSYEDSVVAHNTIYRGKVHPSRLILPVTKVYSPEKTQEVSAAAP